MASNSASPSGIPWLAISGLAMGVFMATLDSSIVNLALPSLVTELKTDFATIQWVMVAYTMTLASLLLGAARLGDLQGKRRVYLWGLGLFTLGSLLCGLAPTAGWLIGFRAFQGVGAAMMQGLGVGIVAAVTPPAVRGRALGLMGGVVSVGLAVGPALGGLLIGTLGWRSVFLVNVPLGLLTWPVVIRHVRLVDQPPDGQRFDALGAALLFLTLAAYALGMTLGQRSGFGQTLVMGLLVGAAMGLGLFLAVESRLTSPMITLGLFKNPLFSLNLLMGLTVFVTLGAYLVVPFYLELVRGLPTAQAGLMMMIFPLTMGLVAPWAGRLSDRWGSRGISFLGLAVLGLGCLAVSTLTIETSIPGYVWRVALLGLGLGLFQSPNNSAIMGAAPRAHLGVAGGLLALSRTLGQTTGLPLMGAVFSASVVAMVGPGLLGEVTAAPAEALVAGLAGTYRVSAAMAGGALLLAAWAWRLDRLRRRPD